MKRFWSKVNKNGPTMPHMKTRCWVWTASTNLQGYGRILFGNRLESAHRVAFFLKHNHWPEPCGLHHCDNPACVRWSHIFPGTRKDNNEDKEQKGRAKHAKGSVNGSAALNTKQILEIRNLHTTGKVSQRALAKQFNVGKSTIGRILRHENWRHV